MRFLFSVILLYIFIFSLSCKTTLDQSSRSSSEIQLEEPQEKPQGIVIPVSSLGDVSETRQQILQNSLEDELKEHFTLISQERFEEAQEKAFEELDYEECTEDQCIMLIQEMLQVENVFHLQVIGEGSNTQLSLSWRTLDVNKKETDTCLDCDTFDLDKKIMGIVDRLLFNKGRTIGSKKQLNLNENNPIKKYFHHFFNFNGHTYAVSKDRLSWSEIKQISDKTNGYPIKINSFEENIEISIHYGSATSYNSLLIGLTDFAEEGNWKWFDSSKPDFTYWANGEPNDSNSNEDFAVIILKDNDEKNFGEWNDHPPTNQKDIVKRVIFEWDSLLNESNINYKNGIISSDDNEIYENIIKIRIAGERYKSSIPQYKLSIFYRSNNLIQKKELFKGITNNARDTKIYKRTNDPFNDLNWYIQEIIPDEDYRDFNVLSFEIEYFGVTEDYISCGNPSLCDTNIYIDWIDFFGRRINAVNGEQENCGPQIGQMFCFGKLKFNL